MALLEDNSPITEEVILVQVLTTAYDDDIAEFKMLASSANAIPIEIVYSKRMTPCAKTYVGNGKVAEIADLVLYHQVKLVIFNCELSPSQERNIEKIIKCRVLGRTSLILDIFAKRARTYEGKLQVELAQLQHLATRLIRGWTHLERQKGGIGLRGPGETQLETDRRLLRNRIKQINKLLTKVKQQRLQSRQARTKSSMPIISLVGYTNAGKSTLFNSLANTEIYAADRLFATLDPTIRKIKLPMGKQAIITDTVGFINNLPHELVAAFSATLEEIRESDLLLHVINVDWHHKQETMAEVNRILALIQAEHVPQIIVYNQIDKAALPPKVIIAKEQIMVWISALTKDGMAELLTVSVNYLYGQPINKTITLQSKAAKLRAQLYLHDLVVSEKVQENGDWELELQMHSCDEQLLRTN